MRYILYILLFSLLVPSQTIGTTSASFLGIGLGSRAMGMGGAFTSMTNDASSIYWNPGSISNLDVNKFQMLNTKWLIDTQWFYSSYSYKINNGTIAMNIFYLDYGEEEITTIYDQDGTGDYWTAYDMSIGMYYGTNITDRFSFGLGGKYINQSIYNESASTFAIDMGLLYQDYENNFRLGASVSNIGFDMKLDGNDLYLNCDLDSDSYGNNDNVPCILSTEKFPLPVFYRLGISKDYEISENFLLINSIDWVIPSDDVEHFNIGSELNYYNKVFLRLGYRHLGKKDSEEGLTFGLGTKLFIAGNDLEVNYTYHNFGVFGYIPYFEFILNF